MSTPLLPWYKKYWLKYTDRVAYKLYKKQRSHVTQDLSFIKKTKRVKHPVLTRPASSSVSFKHSGHTGDIMYSLPVMLALAKEGTIKLYLHINQPMDIQFKYHPLGNVGLTEKSAEMLKALLIYQPKIESVEVYNGEPIDYNLDEFRDYSFYSDRNSISRWYFHVYGVNRNLGLPWLQAPIDPLYKNKIVIARSHRYRSPLIDYSFLKKYPNKLFVGVPEEYDDMKKFIPDLEFKPVKDFLELATIINSCKLFIGNQSFPFSVAEALKANRLLELYYQCPNVIVEGEGANDFMYQPQFEFSVARLLDDN